MSGRVAASLSDTWRSLYFPAKDRDEVAQAVPDGHILGISAITRRKWKVWLMTDDPTPHKRIVVWKFDHITGTAKESALFALRKHAAPSVTVTADQAGNVLDIDG